MPVYTLCPNYVNHGCEDNDDFVNILLSFCQTNGRKIAFDDSNKIIDAYKNVVENKEFLNIWLKFLTTKSCNYEIVSADLQPNLDNNNLILTISSCTFDRNLTCESKTDYLELREKIAEESINLIDKDELRNSFNNSGTQIIQNTIGNNSPIISGDNNQN